MDFAQVRAAGLALVILAHGIVSIPLQSKITPESLAKPEARVEVDGWMRLIEGLGLPVDRARFEAIIVEVSGALITVDRALTRPIQPILNITGTGQGWALFATPDSRPHTLTVEGRAGDGPWRVLHQRLGDTRFLHYVLSYRRIRGVYDGSADAPGRGYRNLARWISARAFETWPELTEVRIRQPESHTTLPGQPRDPKIQDAATCQFARGDAEPKLVRCDKKEAKPKAGAKTAPRDPDAADASTKPPTAPRSRP